MGKEYCDCEETKDDFGGCVPNETNTKCIACGKSIKKSDLLRRNKMEGPRFECQSDCEDYINYMEEVIEDLVGYVRFAAMKDTKSGRVLMNVVHDLSGIYRKDKFFTPRTKGYKKYLKEE